MQKIKNQREKNNDREQLNKNKILGIYPQKQNGLFMLRIKIPGGRITWHQWRKISELAASYSSGVPIHLTTRQDIELHDISRKNIDAILKGLAAVAVNTFGAGGDSIRNITVCTSCDFQKDGFDLFPLAQFVRSNLQMQETIFNLPRKFKISFSGCKKACARPFINDLGFIAQENGQFTVIAAGSLGARPALGIKLYENLPAKYVTALSLAALLFFEKYGNRKNRTRARFRHIREKIGDNKFKAELEKKFVNVKKSRNWTDIIIPKVKKSKKLLHRLQLPNGNIQPEDAIKLADIAQPEDATLRINLEHGLEIYGKKKINLTARLSSFAKNPTIIACPGSETCPRGLVNCWKNADSIRKSLAGKVNQNVKISISGCPNNCAYSAVSDIGLVGRVRSQKGKTVPCFRLFTRGGNGANNKLANQVGVIDQRDVAKEIKLLLKQKT